MILAFFKIFCRSCCAVCLSLLASLMMSPLASASGGLSQGFTTTASDVVPGTLMALTSSTDRRAEPAVSSSSYQLLGIVADEPLIALSDGNSQVQIAVSGSSQVLVSSLNGDVKAGDKITASPIKGVGMKATDAGQIVGTAQANLGSRQTTLQTISDKAGKQRTIKVGTVAAQINITYYGGQDQGKLAAFLPPFFLSAANGVAGQQVSPLRVVISLFALAFGFIIVANMLQSAVRSGIIALGRNPLAKNALRHELVDVLLTALAVLVLTLVVVYIILKI